MRVPGNSSNRNLNKDISLLRDGLACDDGRFPVKHFRHVSVGQQKFGRRLRLKWNKNSIACGRKSRLPFKWPRLSTS